MGHPLGLGAARGGELVFAVWSGREEKGCSVKGWALSCGKAGLGHRGEAGGVGGVASHQPRQGRIGIMKTLCRSLRPTRYVTLSDQPLN